MCVIVIPTRSPAAQALWETMLTSKHKEGVMEVRRHLVEAASKEKLPIKMGLGKKRQGTDDTCPPPPPQIYQKYTRKFSPVDLNSLGEAKGCSISQRNHSASCGPLFFLCHVFAPVSTEEI